VLLNLNFRNAPYENYSELYLEKIVKMTLTSHMESPFVALAYSTQEF